jgi:hypothetical protein
MGTATIKRSTKGSRLGLVIKWYAEDAAVRDAVVEIEPGPEGALVR